MDKKHLPESARNLDALPDSARIDLAVMMSITSKSRATIYRWAEQGILPKPRRHPKTQNYWIVGEVRRALSAE